MDMKATASARIREGGKASLRGCDTLYIRVSVFLSVVTWTSGIVSSSEGLLVHQYAPMDIKAMR